MRKILSSLIIFLSIIACGSKTEAQQPEEDSKTDTSAVVIAVLPTLDCLPLYVAKERGMFEKQGLRIALRQYSAQMDVDTALTKRWAKGAMTDVFRAERLIAAKFPLTYATQSESQWTLVTNRSVRLNKLEQFGDKMVAMTRYSATDYLTDEAFRDVKTTAPFFKVQINDIDIRLKMLLNNEMDAAWLPEPFATQAELAGHKRIKMNENRKLGVIAFSTAYIQKRQKADFVDRFCKAYSESCDSLNKYGFAAYASELALCCSVDTALVNRMPSTVFASAKQPVAETLALAKEAAKSK